MPTATHMGGVGSMITYAIVYFGTALLAILLVPVVSRVAKRYNLVDAPGPRKVHQSPVPRVGGVVFVVATLALVLPVFILNNDIGQSFQEQQTKYIVFLASAVFIFVVGFIDDLRSVKPGIKFLCLVGASLAICASGATLRSISFGSFELELGWVAWPLAVIWITTITVGMNFVDGLDGLAGGIAVIVCGTIAILAFWNGHVAMAVLMLALLGSVQGFLFFNFHPAKIFMGDGGAMFLGFMVGAGSLVSQAKTCTLVGLALPILALGVPILDAGFTVIRRSVLYRRSIFAAERGHLHHRLLDLGLNQRAIAIIIYAVTGLSAGIGILMLTSNSGWSIGIFGGGLVFLVVAYGGLGGARIRETMRAVKRNQVMSREKKEGSHHFEDAQLRMSRAMSFDKWWESLSTMAEQMQFQTMELHICDNGNPPAKQVWRSEHNDAACRAAEVTLPLRVHDAEIKIKVGRNGSLELTCRNIALFGRLVDEFPPPSQRGSGKPDGQRETSRQYEDADSYASTLPGSRYMPRPVDVMGVPVMPFESYSQALGCIEATIEEGRKSFWIAVNPQKIYRAWHDQGLSDVLKRADATYCDGVGVSIASKILHGHGLGRITGCDLFFKAVSMASKKGLGVFLLGASPESNSGACRELKKMHPDLRIVGRQDGYFKDSAAVVEQINASKADLLFVAMGTPKQEYWIDRHREDINASFCMGVGGSFDVASGTLKRAPEIFQRTGTEFVFQLITEPLKRWPRQKVYFPFMFRVIGRRVIASIVLAEGDGRSAVNVPESVGARGRGKAVTLKQP